LRGVDNFSSGYAIGKVDPAGIAIRNPVIAHETYPWQLGGQGYVGGFERNLPKEIMWPDFYQPGRMSAKGNPMTNQEFDYSFTRQKNDAPFQLADQAWVDRAMKWLEMQRQGR
jgi:hypothetical protein